MMRKLALLVVMIALFVLVPTRASLAQAGGSYVLFDQEPVPEGQIVEILSRSDHQLALKWRERIQDGFYVHNFNLNTQTMCIGTIDACGTDQLRIVKWLDLRDNMGRYWPDGYIDLVILAPVEYGLTSVVPYFTPEEAPVLTGEMVEIKRPDYAKKQGLVEVYWTDWNSGYCTILPEGMLKYEQFDPGPPAHYVDAYPADGAIGVIKEFWDVPIGEQFRPDGIVDRIVIHEARNWTSFDVDILHAERDFQDELFTRNLAFVDTLADAAVSYYEIDGKRAEPGPWGLTFKVRQMGSVVTAIHETSDSWIGWSADGVFPGMYVRNGAKCWISELGPEEFLWEVGQRSHPQWQWKKDLIQYGEGIFAQDNTTTIATLQRLGFYRAGWQQWDKFTFWVHGGHNQVELPPHTNKVASDLEVIGEDFGIKYNFAYCGECWDANMGVLYWGDYPGAPSGPDVVAVELGEFIVVVPNNKLFSEFHWQDFAVYELVRSGWRDVVLHQIIWTK